MFHLAAIAVIIVTVMTASVFFVCRTIRAVEFQGVITPTVSKIIQLQISLSLKNAIERLIIFFAFVCGITMIAEALPWDLQQVLSYLLL